jgi:hypothetical protein
MSADASEAIRPDQILLDFIGDTTRLHVGTQAGQSHQSNVKTEFGRKEI